MSKEIEENGEQSEWLAKSLDCIHTFLKEHKFTTLLTPVEEPPKSQFLMISLGEDLKNREYVLQLNYIPLPTSEVAEERAYPFGKNIYLQFVVNLPFQSKKKYETDLIKIIAQLNASIELPGLGYNEVLNQLYFRYVYFFYDEKIHKKWLLSLFVYIRTILDLFSGWIEDISEGKVTLEEMTEKWKNLDPQVLAQQITAISSDLLTHPT